MPLIFQRPPAMLPSASSSVASRNGDAQRKGALDFGRRSRRRRRAGRSSGRSRRRAARPSTQAMSPTSPHSQRNSRGGSADIRRHGARSSAGCSRAWRSRSIRATTSLIDGIAGFACGRRRGRRRFVAGASPRSEAMNRRHSGAARRSTSAHSDAVSRAAASTGAATLSRSAAKARDQRDRARAGRRSPGPPPSAPARRPWAHRAR